MAKNIDESKICAYCENSQPSVLPDEFICRKKGMVSATGKCRSFVYDPLKRRVRPRNINND